MAKKTGFTESGDASPATGLGDAKAAFTEQIPLEERGVWVKIGPGGRTQGIVLVRAAALALPVSARVGTPPEFGVKGSPGGTAASQYGLHLA